MTHRFRNFFLPTRHQHRSLGTRLVPFANLQRWFFANILYDIQVQQRDAPTTRKPVFSSFCSAGTTNDGHVFFLHWSLLYANLTLLSSQSSFNSAPKPLPHIISTSTISKLSRLQLILIYIVQWESFKTKSSVSMRGFIYIILFNN